MKENNVHLIHFYIHAIYTTSLIYIFYTHINCIKTDMSSCKVDKYSFTLVINHLKKRIDGHIILPIRIDLS